MKISLLGEGTRKVAGEGGSELEMALNFWQTAARPDLSGTADAVTRGSAYHPPQYLHKQR